MMSDTEVAPTANPGPGKSVKFANPRQTGAMFPAFQSRCSIQKGLLTKALNSVQAAKNEFCQAMEGSSAPELQKHYIFPSNLFYRLNKFPTFSGKCW